MLQRIAAMKIRLGVIALLGFIVLCCGDDDSVSCVTCSNDLTANFTLCREANGDASVNGEDTDTDYDTYLTNLTNQGTSCN